MGPALTGMLQIYCGPSSMTFIYFWTLPSPYYCSTTASSLPALPIQLLNEANHYCTVISNAWLHNLNDNWKPCAVPFQQTLSSQHSGSHCKPLPLRVPEVSQMVLQCCTGSDLKLHQHAADAMQFHHVRVPKGDNGPRKMYMNCLWWFSTSTL